jgi:hypothetical protein
LNYFESGPNARHASDTTHLLHLLDLLEQAIKMSVARYNGRALGPAFVICNVLKPLAVG